jgi:cold shock CspA family protein
MAERGFGFIRCLEGEHSGEDFFFHASGLDGVTIAQLEQGSEVIFEVRNAPKGLRAEHVSLEGEG